jgi:arsenate reductase
MNRKKVLFVCTHNSARSQMAEAYLRKFAGRSLEAHSAGFQPRPLNPLAVEVMAEEGLDISGQEARGVFDLYQQGRLFDYVITVCGDSEDRCPLFPGITQRLHWPFPDPAALAGSHEERLAGARRIRDQIKDQVLGWVRELGAAGD